MDALVEKAKEDPIHERFKDGSNPRILTRQVQKGDSVCSVPGDRAIGLTHVVYRKEGDGRHSTPRGSRFSHNRATLACHTLPHLGRDENSHLRRKISTFISQRHRTRARSALEIESVRTLQNRFAREKSARLSNAMTDIVEEVQKLYPEVAQTRALYGMAGAVQDGYLFLASHFEMIEEGIRSGAVYVYELQNSGTWDQIQKLVAFDATGDNALFGLDLAISGNVAIVGAPGVSDRGINSGKAYIFERGNSGKWEQIAVLAPEDREQDDNFGISVDIDGWQAIAGVLRPSANGESVVRAYIFERDKEGNWLQTARLVPPDPTSLEWYGSSVSISNNVAMVGSYGNRIFLGNGSAHIYERQVDGAWNFVQTLLPTEEMDMGYGRHVVIQNNTALVAASNDLFYNPGQEPGYPGAVYVYEKSSSNFWQQTGRLISEEGKQDSFGFAIALYSDIALIGAYADNTNMTLAGAAYLFQKSDLATWEQVQVLLPNDPRFRHGFGSGVATDGSWFFVGAINDSDRMPTGGAAYMYALTSELASSSVDKGGFNTVLIVSVTVGALLGIIVMVLWFYFHKKREAESNAPAKNKSVEQNVGYLQQTPRFVAAYHFSYTELKDATNNFSKAATIGEGGFGPVYRGILSDGTVAAIKKLSSASQQGEDEFFQEVDALTRFPHPHVVPLMGCCWKQDELLLVYHFMQGGTLRSKLSTLSWMERVSIALQCGQALAYFHNCTTPPILHRDFKSDNILLDGHNVAYVADLGLAQLMSGNLELTSDIESSTRTKSPAGTIGYMAPEYAENGILSPKLDVYSFGVVLLELISSRSSISFEVPKEKRFLTTWLRPLLDDIDELEKQLGGNLLLDWPREHLQSFCQLAKDCTSENPEERPSMQDVVTILCGLTGTEETSKESIQEEEKNGRNVDTRSLV